MEDKRGARVEGIKDDIWQLNRTRITMSTKEYNPMNDKKGNCIPRTHKDSEGRKLEGCASSRYRQRCSLPST